MDYYQKNSSEYINKTKDADLSKERDELLKMLPKKGKILDIGFGSGRDSLAFKELGYDVISIDSCKEFCEYGKSLGLSVINTNVKDITFNNEFDGIWACASLLHIEYNELANVFNKIRIAMKDDAVFYCSFKYGDFEGVRDERYYTDMTLEKIQAVLINTNLRIIKYWLKEDSLNRDNKWISFLLKKRNKGWNIMESGRKSLSELFVGNKYFYIPDYQRNYAWEDKQINDFFDDFKANYNGVNKRYYYGTILLQDRGTEGIKERYDIVDGQQRLTTLIVFIKCLIDRVLKIDNRPEDFDDETISNVRKQYIVNKGNYILNLQNDDNDFFHTYILSDNIYSDDFRTPSQKRLYHLKDEFNKKLSNVSDEVTLAFLDKIYSTNVLVYLVGSRSEASLIFETTNDRGKLLTNIEKTKSYLMYKASLLDDSEQLLNTIQSRFNQIYQDFASFEGRQIQEDAILQYSFIAHENWSNTGKQKEYQHYMETMKDKVEKMLDANDYEGFRNYVESYTLNLQQSFSIIKKIFANQTEEFKDLLALNVLYNFYPLLIKTYKYDQTEDKIEFRKICRLLEIFVFRVYLIQKYLTNKFQSKWFELAKRFNGNYSSLGNSIIDLIKNPEVGSDETFISALEDKSFFDKYNSSTKNYFFWKYENYLRTKQPVATPMPHDDLKKVKGSKTNLSIEHIVARKNTEEHSKIIADEGIIVVGHGDKFNKEYLNSIGNLTIDPMSANSSKGKKDVEEKISKYFNKAPYKCQNELEDYMVDGKWRIESLEKRKNSILKFAKETWCSYDKFYVQSVVSEDINNIEEDEDLEEENNG